MKGLETAVGKPAVEGAGDASDRILQELEASEEGFAVGDGNTHDNVRVTTQVLGNRVNDDIGTELERLLVERAHEGVVDDENDFRVDLFGNPGHGLDVHKPQRGVG